MLAVIDETTPFVAGGICYAVVAGVLLSDEDDARSIIRAVVPRGRVRPFHWHQEGIVAKTAMESAIAKVGVVAHAVVIPCSHRRQEAARAVAMEEIVLCLLEEGCDRLLIESRAPAQDGRDRQRILDLLRGLDSVGSLNYAWSDKSEPLLWIADALAGAVKDHVTGSGDDRWHEGLRTATGLSLIYRCLPPAS